VDEAGEGEEAGFAPAASARPNPELAAASEVAVVEA
jgi:hypothetical protein